MTSARDFARGVNPNYSEPTLETMQDRAAHLAASIHNDPAVPSITRIMAYEAGELNHEEIAVLFQELIDCGLAWKLQGHYGRTACDLINAGWCVPCKS